MYWPLAQTIRNPLDEAIRHVAEAEFVRLSRNRREEEIRKTVRDALEALGTLQQGEQPDYDCWVALFYLTWYQPRQIYIAAEVLEPWMSLPRQSQSVCILDYGSGASAVQFALVTALAHWSRHGTVGRFEVVGIDPSEPMRALGEALWKEFRSLRKSPELAALDEIIDSIGVTSVSDVSRTRDPDTEYWLTAMHAVYDSNQEAVQSEIARLRETYRPTRIAVTSHWLKRSAVEFVLPDGKSRELAADGSLCEKITEWRARLHRRIEHPFLQRPVFSTIKDTVLRERR